MIEGLTLTGRAAVITGGDSGIGRAISPRRLIAAPSSTEPTVSSVALTSS
jgi:hypothetical protein